MKYWDTGQPLQKQWTLIMWINRVLPIQPQVILVSTQERQNLIAIMEAAQVAQPHPVIGFPLVLIKEH